MVGKKDGERGRKGKIRGEGKRWRKRQRKLGKEVGRVGEIGERGREINRKDR